MPETVSVAFIGSHGPVDVPNPNGFGDIATDVKKGASIDVPEDVAKSLLEQVDNWQRAEKPKPQTQKDKV